METLKRRINGAGWHLSQIGPAPSPEGWPAGSTTYKLRLTRDGRGSMTFAYTHGPAIRHDPELVDVLECLLADAGSVAVVDTFEEWAADLGYDPDSRADERVYRAACSQTDKLRKLFHDAAEWELYLYETERG